MLAMVSALVSCQVASPAERIRENPVLFASLPVEDKLLVQNGQIRAGMSQNAVRLAWGLPNSTPLVGEQDGKCTERWVYLRYEPVMVSAGVGTGFGHGPCGWHHGCHGVGMNTATVPRQVAWVLFENGQVVAWESTP